MERETKNQLQFEKGGKALYIQIKDIYRRRILSGQLRQGDKIDSESEIQKLFGVSRITARQAILDLEKEGMVNRGRGKGTFVIWKPIPEATVQLKTFNMEMKKQGKTPGLYGSVLQKERVSSEAARSLGLNPGEEMLCYRRTRTADGIRICYAVSYYPVPLDADTMCDISEEAVHTLLGEQVSAVPSQVQEELFAQIPAEDIRRNLNVTAGSPVLVCKRTILDEVGKPLEKTLAYYRSDMYSYSVSSRIESKQAEERAE